MARTVKLQFGGQNEIPSLLCIANRLLKYQDALPACLIARPPPDNPQLVLTTDVSRCRHGNGSLL
jgi:hypothetical protein